MLPSSLPAETTKLMTTTTSIRDKLYYFNEWNGNRRSIRNYHHGICFVSPQRQRQQQRRNFHSFLRRKQSITTHHSIQQPKQQGQWMEERGWPSFSLSPTTPASTRKSTFHSSISKPSLLSPSSSSSPTSLSLSSSSHDDNHDTQEQENQADFEPTWTYVPHDPKKQQQQQQQQKNQKSSMRRSYSSSTAYGNDNKSNDNWVVPKSIYIPEDQLEISFVRSSGSGGQNVNKVNTKVDVKFHVQSCTWIPKEVKERLSIQQSSRMNKDGYLSWSCQEYRTQGQNRKEAISKLQQWILQAWVRPKVRKVRKGISKAAKERNKEFKKKRSEVKSNRKRVDW